MRGWKRRNNDSYFPSTKRIILGKREELHLFLGTSGTPRIFSFFLTNIENAQASSDQETSYVYKEEQISPFLKIIKKKPYKFDIASITIKQNSCNVLSLNLWITIFSHNLIPSDKDSVERITFLLRTSLQLTYSWMSLLYFTSRIFLRASTFFSLTRLSLYSLDLYAL
jgi:hypothetical protein